MAPVADLVLGGKTVRIWWWHVDCIAIAPCSDRQSMIIYHSYHCRTYRTPFIAKSLDR